MSVTLEDATKSPMRMIVSDKPNKPISEAERQWFINLSRELMGFPATTFSEKKIRAQTKKVRKSRKVSPLVDVRKMF